MSGSIITLFFIVLSFLSHYLVDPNLAYPQGYPSNSYPFYRSYMWNNPLIDWGPGIATYQGPEFFLLGTDGWGRDLFKMIILAIPVDLSNSVIITVSAAIFGTIIGAVAGYVGGKVDELIL